MSDKDSAARPPAATKAPSELRKERLEREKAFIAGRQADLKREAAERQAKRDKE